jgi:DUF438 domain-containing protein
MTRPDADGHSLETMFEEHVTTIDHLELLLQAIRAPRTEREQAIPRYRELLVALLADLEEIVVKHFLFEERQLFPLLRQAGKAELADVLAREHVAIRAATLPVVSHLHAALAADPGENAWAEFGQLARKLAEMHRTHMQREESEMVPVLRAMPEEGEAAPIA